MILVGLDIYTEYAISVQAINLAGEGPKSQVIFEKTLEGCKIFYLHFIPVLSLSNCMHPELFFRVCSSIQKYQIFVYISFIKF